MAAHLKHLNFAIELRLAASDAARRGNPLSAALPFGSTGFLLRF